METRDWVTAGLVLVVFSALGLQQQMVSQLHRDVAALSAQAAAEGSVAVSSARPRMSSGEAALGVQTPGPGAVTSGEAVPVDPADLEALVHRTVQQQAAERKEAETAKWVERGTRWTEKVIDEMVAEGTLNEAVAPAVTTVLVNEMHDGMDIKAEVDSGRVEEDDGWAQWFELRETNNAALAELVGADSVEDIRGRFERK